jgi:hypothetical protein
VVTVYYYSPMPIFLIKRGFATREAGPTRITQVPIALRDGRSFFAKIHGFFETSKTVVAHPAAFRQVIILDVLGFSPCDNFLNAEYYGDNAVALGFWDVRHHHLYVPLSQSRPIIWCHAIMKQKPHNKQDTNVVELFKFSP